MAASIESSGGCNSFQPGTDDGADPDPDLDSGSRAGAECVITK